MDKNISAFAENVKKNQKIIKDLQERYRKAIAAKLIIKELIKECNNRVLKDNYFCAVSGGRIEDERDDDLMSESEFERYLKLCCKEYSKAGITDEDGFYTEFGNAENRLMDIEKEVCKMTIHLIPDIKEKEILKDITNFKGVGSFEARQKMLSMFLTLY